LATRIACAFGGQASTLGVFFERPSVAGRPASAGWYNTLAFEKAAHAQGLYAKSINGDAFSNAVKTKTIETLLADLGPVDLVIYSLASPKRIDPETGTVYQSVLKPIGESFQSITVNTDKKCIEPISLEPATAEEIEATRKVMGGEDWALWIKALGEARLLAEGAQTIAYSYIGPEVTWPIYHQGTIGQAKADLDKTAHILQQQLQSIGGQALVAINKVVVTQASSAIPVVPLYTSLVFKVMKEKGLHEDCIQQMYRLCAHALYNGKPISTDTEGRIRMDDWEMRDDVQAAVRALWPEITTDNLNDRSDFTGYQQGFLKLFGFGLPGVDYTQPVEIDQPIMGLIDTTSTTV